MNNIKENITDLESLRNDIVIKQKKGLPFIGASIVICQLVNIAAWAIEASIVYLECSKSLDDCLL